MKLFHSLVVVGAAAALLTGCGAEGAAETPQKARPLGITLDGQEGAENVGVLMADRRGYFAEAGLQVEIFRPGKPYFTLGYVVDGTVDLGVTQLPQVVLAKEKGAPVVALGSLISQPTAALIWLRTSGIRHIGDLKGKTIAYPGVPFQRDFLRSVLARSGLSLRDVELERVGYQLVPALASGRADAIFGGSWNLEGVQLESRGLEPVVTRVEELGVPAYDELVVIARAELADESPQLMRKFMAAVARGTAAAAEDPEAATEAIRHSPERDPHLSEEAMEAEVDATAPLLSEDGYMAPSQAKDLVAWMRDQDLIRGEPPVPQFLTNEFVEGG